MTSTATGIQFASGLSTEIVTEDALRAVIAQLHERLTDKADLVIVFATDEHADQFEVIHRELSEALEPQVLMAMTAQGVLGVGRELEHEPGLSVLAARLPGATLRPFAYDDLDATSWAGNAQRLLEPLAEAGHQDQVRALMLLADPFSTPVSTLLPLLSEVIPGLPIVGGMASAGRRPGDNRLMLNGRVTREGAVGLIIGGNVNIHCTVSQGCRPLGKPYIITKAKRHLVQELGGVKALTAVEDLIRSLDDEDRLQLQASGLLVGRVINEYKPRFGPGDFIIRNVIGFDQEQGYIAIADPHIRVGQTVQFHTRDREAAERDFQLLLEAQKLHQGRGGALLFTCNGRGQQLFERPNADAAMVQDALGDLPLAGLFAAGEIGPVGDTSYVHGHTASLIVFREPAS